jgi:hypothetical protein
MKNKALRVAIVAMLIAVTAVLDYIGVISFPVAFLGVSGFYIGAAFFTAFGFWFGIWGMLSMYVGLVVATLFTGVFSPFVFILSWGDVLGAALPMVVFKKLNLDISLRGKKELAAYAFTIIGQNMLSGTLTIGGWILFGLMPMGIFPIVFTGWVLGGIIVCIVIGIPLITGVSPFLKKTPLYVEKFWD